VTAASTSDYGKLKDGTVLTDEIADELAAEAERGYELKGPKVVGRKSLAGGSGRSPRVNYRITSELHQRARERAEREGKTLSELAREALEQYVRS
jgi:hypothetical protein